MLVAKRMLDALRAPVDLGGHIVTVRASIGVATARGPGGDLLRDADLAMYQAKSQGRDRVVSFDEDMHAAMVASVALEHELRQALAEGGLWLAYQPIVDLETGAFIAAEALCRLDAPAAGVHPAGRGDRADRAAGRVGAGGGVPDGRELAGRPGR